MQCSTKQWLCLVTIVSQSKVLEVPSLCLVFVNKCPCEIIWTVASIPIICITFSENLTQFSMIVNPTIKSLLFSECRSHKNTYKTPYDKYRCRSEKYILNRRVLTGILFSYRLCLKVIDSVCIKVSLITFLRIHYRIPVEIKRCRYCVKQKCFKTWVYKSYIYFNSLFYLPLLPQMNILNSNIEVNGGYHFDD